MPQRTPCPRPTPPLGARLAKLLVALAAALLTSTSARAEDADAGAAKPDIGAAPDPDPTSSTRELVLDIAWETGTPVLARATTRTLATPRKAGRWMGRFALELSEGPVLVERVRFNFPLLHDAPPKRSDFKAPPSFEAGLTTTVRVIFPALERGARFELFDRATRRRWALPWPVEGELGRTPLTLVGAP